MSINLKNSNFNEYTWIRLPNENYVIASCSGTIFFNKNLILENVLYVPDFSFNLISICQLTASLKCELIFSSTKCLIQNSRTKDKIGTVDLIAGLYVFNKTDDRIMSCTIEPSNIWHLRMGHPSDERLKLLQTYYPNTHTDKNYVCDTCHQAKQKKLSFFPSNTKTVQSFELLHIDIWGPCSVVSMLGYKFFLTIVDDFTRYTWVFPMYNKSEVRASVVNFIAYAENHFSTKVKIIRTDNGVEFSMHEFFAL